MSTALSGLADGGAAILVVLSIPFIVLAAGTPLALAILALLWLGRLTVSAF